MGMQESVAPSGLSIGMQMLLSSSAVVIVVREMGNGVDRIESARLAPRSKLAGPGRFTVDLHDSRLCDIFTAGLVSLGLAAALTADYLAECVARPLSADQFELTTWLTMMLG